MKKSCTIPGCTKEARGVVNNLLPHNPICIWRGASYEISQLTNSEIHEAMATYFLLRPPDIGPLDERGDILILHEIGGYKVCENHMILLQEYNPILGKYTTLVYGMPN